MVTQAGLALVGKVGVCVGGRAHSLVELIALAGDGVGAKPADCIAEELGMAGWLLA